MLSKSFVNKRNRFFRMMVFVNYATPVGCSFFSTCRIFHRTLGADVQHGEPRVSHALSATTASTFGGK